MQGCRLGLSELDTVPKSLTVIILTTRTETLELGAIPERRMQFPLYWGASRISGFIFRKLGVALGVRRDMLGSFFTGSMQGLFQEPTNSFDFE